MKNPSAAVGRWLVTLAAGAAAVTTMTELGLLILGVWFVAVVRRARRQAREGPLRAARAGLAAQVVTMGAIVLAAASAPVKTEERVKARRVTLPRATMTVGELRSEETLDAVRPFRYWVSAPAGLDGLVVRFPSSGLTVGQFIEAVEAQTPLRHRFGHCGNGSSILWGGDCSFGLSFRVPPG